MPLIVTDTKAEASEAAVLQTSSRDHEEEHAWLRFMTRMGWYPKEMLLEEKQLVLKLDLSILVFGCLSFFTKYLDQQSLTNAYVRLVEADLRSRK